MITQVDERFRCEIARYDLRCTCESCGAFDADEERCAYGYPTAPHRRLPCVEGSTAEGSAAEGSTFVFCKAFELA